MLSFFFVDQPDLDASSLVQKGMDVDGARDVLSRVLALAEAAGAWDAEHLEGPYRALAEELGVKTGQLFGTIRVAVTGRTAAPPLFETMAVLGKQRCVARLRHALTALDVPAAG